MSYAEQLLATKSHYPFQKWQANFPIMEQYTQENCMAAQAILDDLIDGLIQLGEDAPKAQKVEQFRISVEALNALNEELDHVLIETGEREELCDLLDAITAAANLNPEDYADGEGIADEWRDW
ncbi:hypothetical protein [Haliscomenobacter sp.]|uniref:hypothetical protein n=1 Tax=Haliscomenobacter sp. TaxID=2717303 RepID=UPI003BAA8BCC